MLSRELYTPLTGTVLPCSLLDPHMFSVALCPSVLSLWRGSFSGATNPSRGCQQVWTVLCFSARPHALSCAMTPSFVNTLGSWLSARRAPHRFPSVRRPDTFEFSLVGFYMLSDTTYSPVGCKFCVGRSLALRASPFLSGVLCTSS